MAKQIATSKLVAVSGLKELQDNLAGLVDRVDGAELQAGLGQIAKHGEWLLKSEARDQGWPERAVESSFNYTKLPPARKQKGPSALFGFRKRGRSRPWASGYVEWGKRKGKLVGESLATMFEFGTAKMRARPALRGVVSQMRAIYPEEVGKLLKQILAKHAK